jgi:two-component system, OmpR family, KDP operon response regulator KdpE
MRASRARPGARILAVSDEVQLRRLVRSILEPIGCNVAAATHAAAAQEWAAERADIVILDLDRLDPIAVSQAKAAFAGAEIIVVHNAGSEVDRVAVLEIGVDHLARPFHGHELSARVRAAQLRRLAAKGYRRSYRHGSFAIDLLDWVVTRDGRRLSLSPSEMGVLAVLAREPGHVATFGEILAGLGRADTWRDRQVLHAFVVGLRRKIEEDSKRPVLVRSEARVGYRLAAESIDPAGVGARARSPEED